MKKTRLSFILLLVLLTPALFLFTTKPIYPSQDGLYHIARIREFDSALSHGQVPPRLAPTILGGIGYPLFVVNYQTPYFISELFLTLTGDLEVAFKSTLAVTYILSAIFAFILFKQFATNLQSLAGAIVFSYLPYRFANMYTRGALGESVALMFVPLVFLGVTLIVKNKSLSPALLALSVFGLITSHTIVFLIFFPMFVAFPFIFKETNSKALFKIALGSLLGLLAASYQIVPSIFEKRFLKFDQNLLGLYNDHFINTKQLLRIPAENINTGTGLQIGIVATLVIALTFIKLIGHPKFNKNLIFFLIFAIYAIFLTNSLSEPLWQNLTALKYILYPWRFLSLTTFCAAFLSVFILKEIKYKSFFAILLIFFAIFTSRHYFLKSTQYVSNFPAANLTTENEYDTIWMNEKTLLYPNTAIATEDANIKLLQESPYNLSFLIKSDAGSQVSIRRLYFPNWNIDINGSKQIPFQKDGLVSFNIPGGTSQVNVRYESDQITKLANISSLISIVVIALTGLIPN